MNTVSNLYVNLFQTKVNTLFFYTFIMLDTLLTYVKDQIEFLVIRFTEPIQPLRIYKILKINNDSHDIYDLTNSYIHGEMQLDLYENERVEYRFMWMNRKNRMITTNPYHAPSIIDMTQKQTVSLYIIKAILLNETDNICENVLERVLKYAGPHHDFYDEEVKMEWLFENDDLEQIPFYLFIMYSNGTKQCVRYGEYIKNKMS